MVVGVVRTVRTVRTVRVLCHMSYMKGRLIIDYMRDESFGTHKQREAGGVEVLVSN
jgi:hypothetical protein